MRKKHQPSMATCSYTLEESRTDSKIGAADVYKFEVQVLRYFGRGGGGFCWQPKTKLPLLQPSSPCGSERSGCDPLLLIVMLPIGLRLPGT